LGQFCTQKLVVDGDRNSRFFHQSATNKKQCCSIVRIKDDSGVWLEQLRLIQQKFIDYFSSRFTFGRHSHVMNFSNLAIHTVTAQENLDLTTPVTENEIYTALFETDPHKAPGPDGFGASFFQNHWFSIKDQLCFAIKDFFNSGKILK